MNPQEISEWLMPLSLVERAKGLNLVSYELTIYAREYGSPDATSEGEAIRRLFGINELQHKLASQTGHYLDGDEATAYPVSVFGQTLVEAAAYYNVGGALKGALSSAKGSISRAVS
jgi:hypothetical protein